MLERDSKGFDGYCHSIDPSEFASFYSEFPPKLELLEEKELSLIPQSPLAPASLAVPTPTRGDLVSI